MREKRETETGVGGTLTGEASAKSPNSSWDTELARGWGCRGTIGVCEGAEGAVKSPKSSDSLTCWLTFRVTGCWGRAVEKSPKSSSPYHSDIKEC